MKFEVLLAAFLFLGICQNSLGQCSLNVDLGPDIEVCGEDRSVVLDATVDGTALDFTWNPTDKINNPFSLHPNVVSDPDESVLFAMSVIGYHPRDNLIQNPSFELGDTLFDSHYQKENKGPGGYLIDTIGTALFDDAKPCSDHTSGSGKMLLAKVSDNQNVPIWCQKVSVKPNTSYHFAGVATGLRSNLPPVLVLKINDAVISSGTLGSFACSWANFLGDWESEDAMVANICIFVSQEDVGNETDFALDDIGFFEVCEAKDEVHYRSFPLDVFGQTEIALPCGQEVQLNPQFNGPLADLKYRWRTIDGNFLSSVYGPNITVNRPGIYEIGVSWTNGTKVCYDTLYMFVSSTLEEEVRLSQNSIGTCADPMVELGLEVPLTLSNLIYSWDAPDQLPISNADQVQIEVDGVGTYGLTVTDTIRNCSTRKEINVMIDLLPSPEISLSALQCTSPYRDLTFTAPLGSFEFSVDGQSFQSSPQFFDLAPGTYQVWARSSNGCSGQDTVHIPYFETVQIDLPEQVYLENGEGPLRPAFNIDPNQLSSFSWEPAQYVNCSDCAYVEVEIDKPTDLLFTAYDVNNCADSAMVRLFPVSDTPVFAPSAFSPNGDGINDQFFLFHGDRIRLVHQLMIFDRWGAVVFKSTDSQSQQQGWNGRIDGIDAPEGSYLYTANAEDGNGEAHQFTGSFLLVR